MRLWQVSSEMVPQGEQVVGQVHAVVVLDGSQVRELEQVLPRWISRGTRDNHLHLHGKCVGVICYVSFIYDGSILTCGTLVQHHRTAGRCFLQCRKVATH